VRRDKPLGPLDQPTLEHLKAAGANLGKSTEVINYLYFDRERNARGAADKLARGGYVVKGPSATGEGYLVAAKTDFVPTPENIGSLRQIMEGIATDFHGDYDGWEAAVTS
jgi:regulator of ribonuclease activity B